MLALDTFYNMTAAAYGSRRSPGRRRTKEHQPMNLEIRTDLARPLVQLERFAEGLEQPAVDRVALRVVFGMPLHAEGKARCVRDPDCLDGAVFRDALDHDALARLEDALPVQGIDADGFAAEQLCKGAARRERDVMPVGKH